MIYCFYMIFLFQFFNIFKTISTTTKDYLYDLPYHINIYWNINLPQYNLNTAKFDIKQQSLNQSQF
jgi:hypothetical protein